MSRFSIGSRILRNAEFFIATAPVDAATRGANSTAALAGVRPGLEQARAKLDQAPRTGLLGGRPRMPVRRYGIYLAFALKVELTGEGLGRHLSAMRGTCSSCSKRIG
jgi:hypothetical protein